VMIILGIDPGTATTGYGLIEAIGNNGKTKYKLLYYDCIVTSKEMEMPKRLLTIRKELKRLLMLHKPDVICIEQLFFGINSRTAMTVGQARGVVLVTAEEVGIPIFEYQGLQVKKLITNDGRADKKLVEKHVLKHLGKRKLDKPKNGFRDDAIDAIAIAISHNIFKS